MATASVSLTANTWTLISEATCTFQVRTENPIYTLEAASLPTAWPNTVAKEAEAGEIYGYTKSDGNLYGYSPNIAAKVSIG